MNRVVLVLASVLLLVALVPDAEAGLFRCRPKCCVPVPTCIAPACEAKCECEVKYVEKTVMVPTYVDEVRTVTCCEYVKEQREKECTVYKRVPVCHEVMCCGCARKVMTYKCVPETVTRTYTVCVPKKVEKEVTVKVCKMVEKTVKVKECSCGGNCPAAKKCCTPVRRCFLFRRCAPVQCTPAPACCCGG